MPELPEVETIVRQLQRQIIDRIITKIEILRPDQWKLNQPGEAQSALKNQRISQVSRRAKFILINFHSGCQLIIHLRMTGKLIWSPGKPVIDKFTRTIFYFGDGSSLQFNDTRALGSLILLKCDEEYPSIKKLGVEPLSNDWHLANLRSICRKSSLTMKDFLMDQNKIAGIGNIYANEILFRSGIHPQRRANTMSDDEIEKLYHIIPKILELAIEKMGTTLGNKVSDYRSVYNIEGEFQNILTVYGREGGPCFKCGSPIIRIKQKDRSSFICENCQRKV
jgi:formamidopyrimidine-DNA glycosylase